MTVSLHGLLGATHTPFDADGRLSLPAVEKQAEHLLRNQVHTAFIGGSTGASHWNNAPGCKPPWNASASSPGLGITAR